MPQRPESADVGHYIARFPEQTQEALQLIRSIIHAAAPEATETISYAIPTFDLHGKHLVHFGGFSNHVGFYPTGSGMERFADEFASFKRGKGSVQFPLGQPLPADLVRRVVEFRVREVEGTE